MSLLTITEGILKEDTRHDVITIPLLFEITMARLLNSRCDFENGFFSCDLPEDAVLLIMKVKTKTGNHTLVEDTEKLKEKFHPWKKPSKEGKQFPPKTSRSFDSQEK